MTTIKEWARDVGIIAQTLRCDVSTLIKQTWPYLEVKYKIRIDDSPGRFTTSKMRTVAKKLQSEVYKIEKASGTDLYAAITVDHTDHNQFTLGCATQAEVDVLKAGFVDNEYFEVI